MTQTNLKMSVIIPTLNRPKALSSCLDSLEKQTMPLHEVIIVVDGKPTDRVQKAIDDFKSRSKLNVIQIDNELRGEQTSRNISADAATGDIVAILEDDEIMVPEWSTEIIRGYQEHPDAAGVGGRVINVTPSPSPWLWKVYLKVTKSWSQKRMGKISFIGIHYAPLAFPCDGLMEVEFLAGGNMSFHREIITSHKFDGNVYFCDEWDYGVRLTRKEKRKLIYNSKAITYHYPNPTGGSVRGRKRRPLAIRDTTTYILKDFNLKYLRLVLYSFVVFIYSILVLRPECMKAIWEGVKRYRLYYES